MFKGFPRNRGESAHVGYCYMSDTLLRSFPKDQGTAAWRKWYVHGALENKKNRQKAQREGPKGANLSERTLWVERK